MYLTGITDEAGESIDTQIRAARALGWRQIELRRVSVDGRPGAMIHDLPDDEFERVAVRVDESGLSACCFSSAIANWGKSVLDSFDPSLGEARRSIPRMKRMGCRLVRIMSFQIIKGADGRPLPLDRQYREERFRRLRELQALFADEGLQAVHENCMNYGGMGWAMTLELLDAVPGLKLVFDTGNPVFAEDFTKTEPRPRQDALEFFRHVRPHVAHVHIKDGRWSDARQACDFTFAGEGEGRVAEILRDIKASGYDGGVSIEPHLGAVFHDPALGSGEADRRFATFVEYGRRLARLLSSA